MSQASQISSGRDPSGKLELVCSRSQELPPQSQTTIEPTKVHFYLWT
jgi:hypothetical protein